MSFKTPVLFLIFNRRDVTQQVFDRIRQARPAYLYVAADGPRQNRPDDKVKCAETRRVIEQVDWHCEVKTLFREENLGCGPAVTSAITWFFSQVEEGIILEDDCLPHLSFFRYCEELLERYRFDDRIKFIGGNNFQSGNVRGDGSYFFAKYPASWGWATWKRAWIYKSDISESVSLIKNGSLDSVFVSKSEKLHWLNSFRKAARSGAHVWDFHYYYAIWKSGGFCITPNKNLVINLGFFTEATHYFLKDSTKTKVKCEEITFPLVHPESIKIDKEADRYTFDHFYSHRWPRAVRLLRENNLKSILLYFINRVLE